MTGQHPVLVGVDLGGTKTVAAVVTSSGVEESVSTPTPALDGPDAVLDTVAELVRRVAGERRVAAVGVGSAGVVDSSRGLIVSSTDAFTGWAGTNVAGGLSDRLGSVPVVVLNDVDAHAMGEASEGAARGHESFLMVTVGTGVGGSLVFDGKPRRGRHHVAGEIAHAPTPGAEGLRCTCGRTGHLEAVAAGPAIVRRYRSLGGSADDALAVFAAASAGDALAGRVVRDAASALGRAVAAVVTVVDPDVVLVGGGVAQAGSLWWAPFEESLRSELIDVLSELPVLPATLGPQAAIIGAARRAALEMR